MSAATVRLDGIDVDLGERRVLDDIHLLQQGGVVVVLGPNGAGKSTLLRCIATVVAPTRGSVSIDGLDPGRQHERTEIRRRLGYLPQSAGWNDRAKVFDVLDYLAVLREMGDERVRRRRVFDVLDQVGLADRVADRIGALSGGMRRRLGIAQSLLASPALLVLDEPAPGLDPEERLRLRSVLTDRRRTTTTIVSTHLTDEAAVADLVVVLDAGRVVHSGPPATLAACAAGRVWTQPSLPPPDVTASWLQPDGTYRCLGTPPTGSAASAITLSVPTLEDGYLALRHPQR